MPGCSFANYQIRQAQMNQSTIPNLIPEYPNPYRLEIDKFNVINFSGGSSSGYMLYHLLDFYDGRLPEKTIVVFCNTGKERLETLDFIHECEKRWAVRIHWLEYRFDSNAGGGKDDPKEKYKVVDYDSASRDGTPFEHLLLRKMFLPNVSQRTCTASLKIGTIDRYIFREFGINSTKKINVLGIRSDEPRRWVKIKNRYDWRTIFPMVYADVSKPQINEFWGNQDFKLAIDSDSGNCDLCFLKGKQKLIRLIHENPESVEWWIKMETELNVKKDFWKKNGYALFNKHYSYTDLQKAAENYTELPVLDSDDIGDCFCSD